MGAKAACDRHTTGHEKTKRDIAATIPLDIPATTTFDPRTQNQRPALALDVSHGVVYVGWASHGDMPPYHGLLMAFDVSTLARVGGMNTTPNSGLPESDCVTNGNHCKGGIWMAGAAPAFDYSGDLYVATGNGAYDDFPGGSNFGESLLKLSPSMLSRQASFTPKTWSDLNKHDTDFGSAGPTMLPGMDMLITGGKDGNLFLLDTNDLWKIQSFPAVSTMARPDATHHIHNSMPVWK